MIRTQIYIPETIHKELVRLAQEKQEPMAHIVRVFIEEGIGKTKNADYTGKTAIRNILKVQARGGPQDLSTNHDHYLYGGPKESEE